MAGRKLMAKTCKTEGCIQFAKVNWGGYCGKCRKSQKFKAVRFAEKAAKHEGDDCLEWPFYRDEKDYGIIGYEFEGVKFYQASRLVCAMAHGLPESSDVEAAHSCGNPSCVNPNHLRWATGSENCQDKMRHGTYGIKLSNEDVREIRKLRKTMSLREVAKLKGITPSHVSRITNRHSWANLD